MSASPAIRSPRGRAKRAYSAQDPDMRQDDSAGKDDSAYKTTKEPHKSGSSVFKSSLRNAVINRAPLVEFPSHIIIQIIITQACGLCHFHRHIHIACKSFISRCCTFAFSCRNITINTVIINCTFSL